MSSPELLFQYCPKLALVDPRNDSVLLCRRAGEADYDAIYSLIGGKMEHGDPDITEAVRREKNEEVGADCAVALHRYPSIDVYFTKRDGSRMVLPHFYAEYLDGDVVLNEEYSDFRWVPLASVSSFEPKISNIAWIVPRLAALAVHTPQSDLVTI